MSTLDRLRQAVANLRAPEAEDNLRYVPEALERLLEAYDSENIDPSFRRDMFSLLTGSIMLAETMTTPTYPAPVGIRWATHLLTILSNIIYHLESRPVVSRYGILRPDKSLHSETYATWQEASHALAGLRAFGITSECLIVPVTVTSGHVVQPPAAPNLGSPNSVESSVLASEESLAASRPPPIPPAEDSDLDGPILIRKEPKL